MTMRRGSLLWSGVGGDAILQYKVGDVVKPVFVEDHYFTGVVRAVDTKANKITVAWGGGPESQHDPDEIMPGPDCVNYGMSAKTASRRMRADVDDLIAGEVPGIPDGTGPHGRRNRRKDQPCPKDKTAQHLENVKDIGVMNDREAQRAIRDAMIAEQEAIKQYEVIADAVEDDKMKEVVQDIANEEKVHVGELQALLDEISPDEAEFLEEGRDEVDEIDGIEAHSRRGADPSQGQYCGRFGLHGIDEPRAGGTSVMKDLAYDLHDEANEFADVDPRIARRATSGNEPSAQRTVEEETAKKSSVIAAFKERCAFKQWVGPVPTKCDICHNPLADWFVDGNTTIGGWANMCRRCFSKYGVGLGAGQGQKWDMSTGRKLAGSDNGLRSRRGTGEMSVRDIQLGGEHYEWAKQIEKAARDIQQITARGGYRVGFLGMKPFDKYQGPYAVMTEGKLWSGDQDGDYYFEFRLHDGVSGDPNDIAVEILERHGMGVKRSASDISGLRSRRAMYWCSPDRTYRLTQEEQNGGLATCPKCRIEMQKERFTRSDKLWTCPECGFKIPTSKAVTQVEVKVPAGVSVEVTQKDESGDEVQGESVMATVTRRGLFAAVDLAELADLPRMTLSQIAMLVYKDWKAVNYAARPYLEAMSSLQNVSDNYGLDSGTSIVAYFLSNANSWRGDVAKAVKKELQRRIR
jgi:rubrerythrin/ribosomal protein L37AE/L43A